MCDYGPEEDRTVYPAGRGRRAARRATGAESSAILRPHIVWFGEALDPADLFRIEAFMRGAAKGRFVFVAAGTSGVVYPAAGLVDRARSMGAETGLVNLEPPEQRRRLRALCARSQRRRSAHALRRGLRVALGRGRAGV
jgi:NAD-dependent deacetylase